MPNPKTDKTSSRLFSLLGAPFVASMLSLALAMFLSLSFSAGCGDSGGSVRETNCSDGKDNDDDGLTDCLDDDCYEDSACLSGDEDCNNHIDDDGDGLTDCDDDDCNGDPACGTKVEHCENDIDDDGDGLTDCDDNDCIGDPACGSDPEECANEIDDDGDGLTDCDDDDCIEDPSCVFGPISCKGVRYCYSCCPSNDLACTNACYAQGTVAAKAGIDAIDACIDGNCSADCAGSTPQACETCVNANCTLQLSQCDWEPAGNGVCVDLYNCIATCPSPQKDHAGDAATCPENEGLVCYQSCYTAADEDAVTKMRAWLFCMEDLCYDECYGPNSNGTDCQNCYLDSCSAEVTACQND